MKLDSEALKPVFAEVDKLGENDPDTIEGGRALAVGIIEIYLKNLGARNHQTAIINLTNARAGMLAIMEAGLKGRITMESLKTPENTQLVDSFIHYLNIIMVTAEAHHHGHLN